MYVVSLVYKYVVFLQDFTGTKICFLKLFDVCYIL